MFAPDKLLLAVESSCDETAVALLTADGEVVADLVHSQIAAHAPFGGVVPEIASRHHLQRIAALADELFEKAGRTPTDVGAVAATYGPGLIGALLVGLQFAKGFAQARGVPFVGVHHLEGHLLAGAGAAGFVEPPFIALIASGGHSAVYRYRGLDDAVVLGETRDDAAGEAFDKAAKLLGLGYPGGKVIDELAEEGDPTAYKLPISLRSKQTYDMSFSGLKTAVRVLVQKLEKDGPVEGQRLKDLAASLRRVVVDALLAKAFLACHREKIPALVLGGGVVANSLLRAEAIARGKKHGIRVFVPPRALCTDNAVMIGQAGLARLRAGHTSTLVLRAEAGAALADAGDAIAARAS